MKTNKKLLFVVLTVAVVTTKAQNTNTFPENGNVGIGTTSPTEKLEVNGTLKFNNTLTTSGRMHITGGEKLYILNKEGVNISKAWGGTGDLEVEGTISVANNALIQGSGRMHINGAEGLYLLNKEGVTVSKAWGGTGNLQVEGKIGVGTSIDFVQSTYGSGFGTRMIGADYGNGKTSLNFDVRANSSTWSTAFKIGSNGNLFMKENLGIGTENPDQKLTVKGKIHSEEVIVDLQVPADYVFEKYYSGNSTLNPNYKLPTLADVEKYTRENMHLPNIPSAKEIQEKGLQVGEMTNLLLQKIEELTLYAIEQQKRIESLEAKLVERE